MKKFINTLISFFFPIIIIVFVLIFLDKSNEDIKIEILNNLSIENTIIIMGDSKSLVDLDYTILKQEFNNYSIINLSLWARNPQYVYSVYKNFFENKHINNSIIIYNLTFRNILNRSNNIHKEKTYIIDKSSIKNSIKTLLNRRHSFEYKNDKNGFIQLKGQKFGSIKDAQVWYNDLQSNYEPNFQYQLSYVDSIRNLFNSTNKFIISEFPHDKLIDSIYQNTEYYEMYQKDIKDKFENKLYFGYMKELDSSKYWYDRDHLNVNGAKFFTPIFSNILKEYIKVRTHNNVYNSLVD